MIQDAIILLAGLGSRLRPLTDNTHKALIEIGGKTILERQITALKKFGIQNFHLTLGYRAHDILNYVQSNFPDLSVRFYENPVFSSTNTAYSLWTVIKTLSRGFLLLDGDVVFEDDLLQTFKNHANDNILLCETDPSKLDPEAVKFCTNSKKQITEIGKHIALKAAAGESIGIGQFQAGLAREVRTLLDDALKNPDNHNWYYEDAFQHLLQKQALTSPLLIASTHPHCWVEIDDAKDLQTARGLF